MRLMCFDVFRSQHIVPRINRDWLKWDYQETIRLLSQNCDRVSLRTGLGPIYKNLSDWMLSDESLKKWMNSKNEIISEKSKKVNSISLKDSPTNMLIDSPYNDPETVTLKIRAIEVGDQIGNSNLLTNSLIASLKEHRGQPTDVFLTLAQHYLCPLPLTKAELMACLCHQLLIASPSLFNQPDPILLDCQDALREANLKWIEISLWRYLITLLTRSSRGQVFLLIHEPAELEFSMPFQRLISDLIYLAETTEVQMKILYVKATPLEPSLQKSGLCIDDLAIQRIVNSADPDIRISLETDYSLLLDGINRRRNMSITLESIRDFIFTDMRDLRMPLVFLSLIERHTSILLNFVKDSSFAATTRDTVATVVQSLLPESAKDITKRGLDWLSQFPRPLTCVEFAAFLGIDFESNEGVNADRAIISDFQKLFCGLVEVSHDRIYIASGLRNAPLSQPNATKCYGYILKCYQEYQSYSKLSTESEKHKVQIEIDSMGLQIPIESKTSEKTIDIQVNAHDVLDAVGLQNNQPTNFWKTKTRDLLPCAVEFLLAYICTKNEGSLGEENPGAELIAEEGFVRFCLEVYCRKFALPVSQSSLSTLPNTLLLKDRLQLSVPGTISLLMAAAKMQALHGCTGWFAIALAACQTDNVEVVTRLIQIEDIAEYDMQKLFETGCDRSLCALAESNPAFVANSKYHILEHAARLGNYEFIRYMTKEPELQGNPLDQDYRPFLYTIAKFGILPLAQDTWELKESGQDSHYWEIGKDGRNILHQAVSSGNTDLVRKILPATLRSAKELVDQEDSTGATPLLLASRHGNISIVKQLLASGANLSLFNGAKKGPLHIASEKGYWQIIDLLLQFGAKLDEKDDNDKTPVYLALANEQNAIANMFLSTISNIDDADYEYAIERAVDSNDIAILGKLRSRFKSMKPSEGRLQDYIMKALKHGYDQILHELLELGRPYLAVSPYSHAAKRGHVKCVQALLAKGYDYPIVNDEHVDSPIRSAVMEGHAAVVRVLIPHATSNELNFAYLAAALENWPDILELLLDAGADINIAYEDSRIHASHFAAYNSYIEIIEILAMRRADFDVTDSIGRTPLHDASSQNNIECVQILARAGANINAEDDYGETPLFCAAKMGYGKVVKILLDAKRDLKFPEAGKYRFSSFLQMTLERCSLEVFELAVKHSEAMGKLEISPHILFNFLQGGSYDAEKIRVLLQNGFNANEVIGEYGTMLHYAALWGRVELLEVLSTDKSFDVNAISKDHGTPLQMAVFEGNPNIPVLNFLLARNADIHKSNGFYGSPLCTVAAMPRHSENKPQEAVIKAYITLANAILEHDPSTINDRAGFYGTPVQFAVASGCLEMLAFLLTQKPKLDFLIGLFGTPLHFAAYKKREDMANILMGSESDLFLGKETYDIAGRLPMHVAAVIGRPGDYELCQFFCPDDNKSSLFLTDKYQKMNSLHLAAARARVPMVEKLLKVNHDAIYSCDADGWTALHWACRSHDFEIVKFLLAEGANKGAKTVRGWTPLDVAIHHGARLISDPSNEERLRPEFPNESQDIDMKDDELVVERDTDVEDIVPARKEDMIVEEDASWNCDVCECTLFGAIYKCKTCIDDGSGYDMCFKCIRRVEAIHYVGHKWEKVTVSGERMEVSAGTMSG